MIDVVVMAGGIDRGEIAAQLGTPYRPLLDVSGKPILLHVLSALSNSARVDRVALVAPDPVLQVADELMVDFLVPAREQFVENLAAGVEAMVCDHVGSKDHLLIVTGDLPLLSPMAVNDFVDRALAAHVEVAYPIIPKESSERVFPGGKRTYVRLAEGTFTGGNAVVLTRGFVERSTALLARLYSYRKSPLKLARLFGPGFLLGLLTGRLSIDGLERRASAIVQAQVGAVVVEHPELGFDVDKVEDLLIAREVFAQLSARS